MRTKLKVRRIFDKTRSYAETGRIVGISRQRVYQIITGMQSPLWWEKGIKGGYCKTQRMRSPFKG